ncbi:adenosylcobinamide-phosphate synthase CbiB [Thermodesulfovibrio yellowstonii]|uniref:Cobalamin biosynthesis protein CobD n=1 Tax=Thermodesulfovibrio yellowstonii TaxID=28262 RepID=A0A9W6GH74_9BACT|nr:adenosylcobinamide-phosphate synthase CbiB [Thermodesulfovibrio islandicus]GLI53736.1 cobalamin biosynthesis protein CobD [Thermodesulfovibrio islandicus]
MKILFVDSWIILSAFLIDFLIGDPKKYHPVKTIGKLIEKTEKFLRQRNLNGRFGGFLLFLFVTVSVFLFSIIFVYFLNKLSSLSELTWLFSYILLAVSGSLFIALRGLIKEANKINILLDEGSLEQARISLKALVGRDTENLTQEKIRIAIIESLAENLSDGVIAPLFYFFIGGLPLMILYKTVNTLDSMVGYKNERYINFGWFSAKMDDIFNYIPARITGLLIVLSSFIMLGFSSGKRALKIILRDGKNHSSPNSGIPEAAMSGAVGIRIGGPNYYGGIIFKKPYIGDDLETVKSIHVYFCIKIVTLSSFIFVLLSSLIRKTII